MLTSFTEGNLEPTSLRTYVSILGRRKWLFILVLLVVPATAVAISLRHQALYEAKAQVLLSDENLTGALGGSQGALAIDPTRIVATQARIARTPDLARRTLKAAGGGSQTADQFLTASSVSPVGSTNVLEFKVDDRNAERASRLATAYAQQFVAYTRSIENAAIQRALQGVVAQMARLAKNGDRGSALYARLAEQAQTLRTMTALQTSRAQLLRSAEHGVKIEPRPKRAALYGVVVAIALGLALVALLEALDTRVRSERVVADALQVPLLGRLAQPLKRLRRKQGLAVLDEPDGADAEAFRILRANFEYANSKLGARTIMLTSSVRGEGKSTTVANIAASFARLGRRVVLVDLDFRRPAVHSRLGLPATPGMSDVALGRVPLERALVRVPITTRPKPSRRGFGRWGAEAAVPELRATDRATLEVLPAGATPADVGEFVGAAGVSEVLRHLREHADVVFIDAPPVLEVSDPMTLMTYMDAVVVITRLGVVREAMLQELRRILDATSVPTLGVVITGVAASDGYGPYHRHGVYGAHIDDVDEGEELQAGLSALRLVNERSHRRPTTS